MALGHPLLVYILKNSLNVVIQKWQRRASGMDKERFLTSGLIEQYVLGLTTPEETQEVERYARTFPEIQQEINALRHAMERYAAQYAVPPPPHLKEKVLAEIQQTALKSTKIGKRQWFSLAAIAVLLGLASWQYWQQRKGWQQLNREFDAYRAQCEQQQQSQQEALQVVAFIKDNHTKVVHLTGTTLLPEAHVIVYWNEATQQAYLNTVHLPPPPPGKQYQIWADVEGEMIPSGLLNNSPNESQRIQVVQHAESLNITIEPAGGSAHPTVELLVVNGKIT